MTQCMTVQRVQAGASVSRDITDHTTVTIT